jgi:hypothetical protein
MNPWRLKSSAASRGNRTDRLVRRPRNLKPRRNMWPRLVLHPSLPPLRLLPGMNPWRTLLNPPARFPARLLPLRDRLRCVLRSLLDKLPGSPWPIQFHRVEFRFPRGPRRLPPGRGRSFPARASLCRLRLRPGCRLNRGARMKRRRALPDPCREAVPASFPACRGRPVPHPVPRFLRPRPSCRELPWARVVRCGPPPNRILPDSRWRGLSSRPVRI